MHINIFCFFSFVAMIYSFVSCHSACQTEWLQTVVIEKALDPIKLKAEVVKESQFFFNAKNFSMCNDSVMVVLNKPSGKNSFVVFHNIKRDESIAEFIRLGRANNEMLNCSAHIKDNLLLVKDFVKNNLAIINIDSVLVYGSDYEVNDFIKFGNTIGSGFVTQYDSNRLIMLNPYCFTNKDMRIDNKQPRFIVLENDITPPLEYNDELYFTFNVTQGPIITNKNKNRVIYASSSLSEIEIYDFDLDPVKKIFGPIELTPTYRVSDGKDISFDKIVPYSYMSSYYNEDYFYLTYVGEYFHRNDKLENFDSYILKFDWDGNLVETYHSPEYIYSLYWSEINNSFYGRGFNDGEIILWKLNIE
ncbi:MAG: hypothetical protein R3Y26_08970 [Rikenellaceae bacterium]